METPEFGLLPTPLREALLVEIDPAETLRWCGQPHARRLAMKNTYWGLLVMPLGLFIGGMLILAAMSIWSELAGEPPAWWSMPNRPSRGDWPSVWASLTLGAAILLASIVGPPIALMVSLRRARRTVYALTTTRVLRLSLSARGLPRTLALEPSHPLSIARHATDANRGDILLYPSGAPPSSRGMCQFALIGVADARRVERLIRATFEPPAPAAT